jgi:hypothetical protein
MKDPQRLTSGPATELGALLLGAGIEERPSDESLCRTLSVLGLAAAVTVPTAISTVVGTTAGAATTAAAAKSGAGVTMGVLFAKWLAVGAVGGGVLLGSTMAIVPPQQHARVELPRPITVIHVQKPMRTVPMLQRAEVVAAPSATPVPMVLEPPAKLVLAPAPEDPLGPEIALVDEARSLLATGQLAGVHFRLSRYEIDFPHVQLLPEVLYLRMEASWRASNGSGAARVAEQIIRQYPRSPQASRARELLEGPLATFSDQEDVPAGTSQ